MAQVQVQVNDATTSAPIPGARVGVFLTTAGGEATADSRSWRALDGVTGAEGLCLLRFDIPAGEQLLVGVAVLAAGHRSWTSPFLPPRRRGGEAPTRVTVTGDQEVHIAANLERGPTIAGTVRRADGRPLAGAEIDLVFSGPRSCSQPYGFTLSPSVRWPPPVVTDAEGFFEWLSLPLELAQYMPDHHHVLCVHHEDHPVEFLHRVEALPHDADDVIHLDAVMQQGETLSGTVLGPDGKPRARAKVVATVDELPDQPVCLRDRRSVLTDHTGTFELRGLARRGAKLEVRVDGCSPTHRSVDLTSHVHDPLVLRVEEGCDLVGTVLGRDGRPSPDEHIYAQHDTLGFAGSTKTDAEGKFALRGLPAQGRLRVTCAMQLELDVDLPSPPLVLRCPPLAELRVRVLPEHGNAPTRVVIWGSSFSTSLELGPDGEHRRKCLPAGRFRIRATAPGHASTEIEAELPAEGLESAIEVHLTTGGLVTGVIRDLAGHPLEGVEVEAQGDHPFTGPPKVKSDATGRYEVGGLEPRAVLRFSCDRLAAETIWLPSTGSPGNPVLQDVTMGLGANVRGQALRRDGSPAARIQVAAVPEGRRPSHFAPPATLTDQEGRFELAHVPTGRIVLCAGSATHEFAATHGAAVTATLHVDGASD